MDKDAPGILTARPEQYLLLGNPVKGLKRLAGELRGLSPAGVVKSLGGKTIPLAGDAFNVGVELSNPLEPSRRQRELNALLVGGGGALASVLTGGWDLAPSLMDVGHSAAQEAGIIPEEKVNVGALLNVENYLRELSYLLGKGLGYGRNIPEDSGILREEYSKIAEQARQPRPYSGGY